MRSTLPPAVNAQVPPARYHQCEHGRNNLESGRAHCRVMRAQIRPFRCPPLYNLAVGTDLCRTWRVLLRTQKSGEPVYLPIPDALKLALDAVPLPRNAAQDCPYYFWNSHTSRRAVVGIAENRGQQLSSRRERVHLLAANPQSPFGWRGRWPLPAPRSLRGDGASSGIYRTAATVRSANEAELLPNSHQPETWGRTNAVLRP